MLKKYHAGYLFVLLISVIIIGFYSGVSLAAPSGVHLVSSESTNNSYRSSIVVDDENNIHIVWELSRYTGCQVSIIHIITLFRSCQA